MNAPIPHIDVLKRAPILKGVTLVHALMDTLCKVIQSAVKVMARYCILYRKKHA